MSGIVNNVKSQTAIYTVNSTSAVTTSGTAPSGSSASYSQSFATAKQITSGNSATLTLSGYAGYQITSIVLEMRSNTSSGSGTLNVVAGSTTIAQISPAAGFNSALWNGAWSTSYVSIIKTPSAYNIASGENVVLTIAATVNSLYIQKYSITYTPVSASPTINIGSLTAFGNQCIGTPSAEKTYTVSGSNLTNNIDITPPAGFEISTTSGSGFISNPSSITLNQVSGSVASTTIYVRFNPATVTSYSNNISHASTGATTQNVAVSGTGTNSAPTVTTPTSTTITTNSAVLGGNVTSGGCTAISAYGVYYSTTSGFTPPVPGVVTTSGSVSGIFTENVSGLNSGTVYYYVAYATNSAGTSYSTEGSFTTLKGEPSNQVTAFACGTTTSSTIPLTWTAANPGTISPDGYLILWSTGAITPPVDGVAQADGAGVKNITYGTNSYTATGLSASTGYNFQIWSYTNSGSNISYNLVSAPATTCTTQSGPCLSEGFSSGTTAPSGWTFTTIGNTYITGGNYGAASPSLQMDATNDRVETPSVSNAAELKFWIKGQGATGSYLLIEGYNGSTWSTIDNILLTSVTTGTTKTYNSSSSPALAAGFVKFRFTYTKSSGNLSFDDVEVTCISTLPTLTVNPTTLSGFTYVLGSGPSSSQSYDLSGTNLTGAPGTINISAPADYEVSNDNITFGAITAIPYSSATLTATPVYVRLRSGLAAGTYNGELAANTGGGVSTAVNVTLNGNVTGPQITTSVSTLSSLNYIFGSGPSASQNYTVSASSLTPASGNITLTAPLDYEISTDNITFLTSLTLPYTANTLAATTIYLRLVTGLAIGDYNSELIVHAGGGASNVNVTLSGSVFDPSAAPTVFEPGDIAVLGVNSNLTCVSGYSAGDDEISFVAFKDITNGTQFYVTDNGYQYANTGQWGDTEGCYEFTRTGGTIAAGTVITFRFKNVGPDNMEYISPDADWSFVKVAGLTTGVVLNAGGDQLYFMQGGSWTNGAGSADVIYSAGTYLFAFNTNSSWTNFGGTSQHSGLIMGMECFSMMPGVATDFIKYTGDMSPTTKRGWIDRINSPGNWTSYTGADNTAKCNAYNSGSPNYAAGYSITINAGGFSPGVWNGSSDNNWFNCANWQDLTVPDENVNVTIPSSGVIYEPTIGNPPTVPVVYTGAECNDIDVQSGRTLTMNHANSRLDIYNNFTQNGTLSFTNGIVNIVDNNSTLGGSGNMNFYNLRLNKTTSTNTFVLNNDISVSNILTLTNGILTTGSNKIIITNNTVTSVTGQSINSYINGNLRRNVLSTGSYDFPVGTASQYELSNISLNSSTGLTYIDSKFTNPHNTSITISPLALYVNGDLLDELLDYGFWTITPNAGSYNYDVTLTSRGHTNQGATAASHSVVKRPNSASNWVLQGTHTNTDQSMGAGWVTAKRRGLTVFSDFAIAKSNSGSLPVSMISFTGTRAGNEVILRWECASEINNAYFTLQRGFEPGSFHDITTITGKGNSNTSSQYEYTDINTNNGIQYYRLVQTDFDGTEHFAGLAIVDSRENSGNMAINMLYSDETGVHFDLLNAQGTSVVSIFSPDGKLLYSRNLNLPDIHSHIDLNDFVPEGMIIVQISNDSGNIQGKTIR